MSTIYNIHIFNIPRWSIYGAFTGGYLFNLITLLERANVGEYCMSCGKSNFTTYPHDMQWVVNIVPRYGRFILFVYHVKFTTYQDISIHIWSMFSYSSYTCIIYIFSYLVILVIIIYWLSLYIYNINIITSNHIPWLIHQLFHIPRQQVRGTLRSVVLGQGQMPNANRRTAGTSKKEMIFKGDLIWI